MNIDIVPSSLEQALDILDGLDKLLKSDLSSSPGKFHHGFGTWIRNNWSLWEKDTPLVRWFNERGIYHADDMSAIIFEAYACKTRGVTYDIQKDIERFREHWRKSGIDPDTMKEIIR